jgi:hypothetical protein
MLKSVAGIYRAGKIELLESPPQNVEGRVIVTFLNTNSIDLANEEMDIDHAADLRQRLRTFAEDWDRPEMDVYDAI